MGILAETYPHEHAWPSVGAFWSHYVPSYRSGSFRPLIARIPYEGIPAIARDIRKISTKRSDNRINNYLNPSEIERVKGRRDFSIRFGVAKPGHGYSGVRGDFCLAAGVFDGKDLTLFYRSIELMGGFAYDLVLIEETCRRLGITPRFISIWAVRGFKFALKGNSNEKLYPKLQGIFNATKRIRTADAGARKPKMRNVQRRRGAD